MAPGIITKTYEEQSSPLYFKANGGEVLNTAKSLDVQEDYEGDYRFAPIEEAQVSRAMIKRCAHSHFAPRCELKLLRCWVSYFNMMYERAVSDVVIIGAGSAGLSCAYHLGKTRPNLKITIIEASVAPG